MELLEEALRAGLHPGLVSRLQVAFNFFMFTGVVDVRQNFSVLLRALVQPGHIEILIFAESRMLTACG